MSSSPMRTLSPWVSNRSSLTGSGSASIGRGRGGPRPPPAAVVGAAVTGNDQGQLRRGYRRTRSIRDLPSLAASISRVSPVAEHVTR